MRYRLEPWWQILYKTLMRLVMKMDSRLLDKNSLRVDLDIFCRRRLLNSSGNHYCYTSVSFQIDSPAIGYAKDTAEYIDITNETRAAHNQQYN